MADRKRGGLSEAGDEMGGMIDRAERWPLYCLFALGYDFWSGVPRVIPRAVWAGFFSHFGISEICKPFRETLIPQRRDRTKS
jgi:hypothetical protein